MKLFSTTNFLLTKKVSFEDFRANFFDYSTVRIGLYRFQIDNNGYKTLIRNKIPELDSTSQVISCNWQLANMKYAMKKIN